MSSQDDGRQQNGYDDDATTSHRAIDGVKDAVEQYTVESSNVCGTTKEIFDNALEMVRQILDKSITFYSNHSLIAIRLR